MPIFEVELTPLQKEMSAGMMSNVEDKIINFFVIFFLFVSVVFACGIVICYALEISEFLS